MTEVTVAAVESTVTVSDAAGDTTVTLSDESVSVVAVAISAPAAAGVTGFNGRTGDVYPETGDYSVSMITGAQTGKVVAGNDNGRLAATAHLYYSTSGLLFSVVAGDPADIPLMVKGQYEQTGNLFEARDYINVKVLTLTPNGTLTTNLQAASAKGVVVKMAASQTANAVEVQNSSSTPTWAVDKNGGMVAASMADGTAANGTVYYSTTQGKLVFKDPGGTVNALY